MKRYEQRNVSKDPYEPWQELREDSDGEWAEHAESVAEIAAEVAKRDVRIDELLLESAAYKKQFLDEVDFGHKQAVRIADLEADLKSSRWHNGELMALQTSCDRTSAAQMNRIHELTAENAALEERCRLLEISFTVDIPELSKNIPWVAELVRLAGEYRRSDDGAIWEGTEEALLGHAFNDGSDPT